MNIERKSDKNTETMPNCAIKLCDNYLYSRNSNIKRNNITFQKSSDWPHNGLLIPGNEVVFSLETASDYLNEYSRGNNNDENRFGFRCLVVGYEDAPSFRRLGLAALETELIHAAAMCASRLLAPDLDIPSLAYSTIVDVHLSGLSGCDDGQDSSEALLLARGLELSSPPTVHQVLEGQPLPQCISTERQFLADFVAGAECTAGGRLARWLAPTPRVEPANCEMKAPSSPMRPGARVSLPILVRDQYGDSVTSPALKLEVVVLRVEESESRQSRGAAPAEPPPEAQKDSVPQVPYNPTIRDTMYFMAITMMKVYQNYCFEELRFASGLWGPNGASADMAVGLPGLIPDERLSVRSQADGSYAAVWTPRAAGTYKFRFTLDDQAASQEMSITVQDNTTDGVPSECGNPSAGASMAPPTKVRRFEGRHSAGLRVRASPSLQAEELGRVPPGANVAFVEEVTNKDGTWVRLSAEAALTFASGAAEGAWCLQQHAQLDRTLLFPLEPTLDEGEIEPSYSGYADQTEVLPWPQAEDDVNQADLDSGEEKLPTNMQNELGNDSDSSSGATLFVFGNEPSKRGRIIRTEKYKRCQRRMNGNSDEAWSPVSRRVSEQIRDVNALLETEISEECLVVERRGGSSVAQTQTSPDRAVASNPPTPGACVFSQEGRLSPKSLARERITVRSRAYRRASSTPPMPARAPTVPRKHALSVAQAESLRAIFAALLWHEGIVHDAIACAAFLKFHPQLPKQGARVVTRAPQTDLAATRPQRHSVEVSNAGQYLRMSPAPLELNRSGLEPASPAEREPAPSIKEEEPSTSHSDTAAPPSVVNVLPPALRALVALWDALYEAEQLSPATDSLRMQEMEKNENDESRPFPGSRKKRDWSKGKTPYSVRCELCGEASVAPPIAAHMRHAHPGCRAPAARGYDRAGAYTRLPHRHHLCGQLAQSTQLWYIYCEKCREKTLSTFTSIKQNKPKSVSEPSVRKSNDVDHNTLRENATFLLELAPLKYSECGSSSPGNSPPSPAGSVWQPAPPFQCLPALGAAPRVLPDPTAKYHSLGRPPTMSSEMEHSLLSGLAGRVHRSVSMGQATGSSLAQAARQPMPQAMHIDDQDTLTGAGSSLLAQPSAALRRLVGCGEWGAGGEPTSVSAFEAPRLDPATLLRSPVLAFVLAKRDLPTFRQKMDAAVRINTVRQFAFEALNWLLRSTTQHTGVHDVMWWFCSALDKYARVTPHSPANDDNKDNAYHDPSRTRDVGSASTTALCPGGRSARAARTAFHAFLGSVSALAPSLQPGSPALIQAVKCWALHYSQHDRAFLHRSQVFSVISRILSHSEEGAYEESLMATLHDSYHTFLNKENYVWKCVDVTSWCDVTVSSRQGMAGALTDGSTETFWESGEEDRNKAKWIQVVYPAGSADDPPHIVCVHVDNTRDTVNKTLLVSFTYSGSSNDTIHAQDVEVDPKVATWVSYTLPRVSEPVVRVRCSIRGPEASVRVRQVRVLSVPARSAHEAMSLRQVLHGLCEADTLRVFRLLTSQVFGKLLEWDNISVNSARDADAEDEVVVRDVDDSDLREHVVGILFAGNKLTNLQRQVMCHIVLAIGSEATRVRDDWETALLCDADRAQPHQHQDNYCFEMLSLLLALSGSSVGRAHLAQRSELVADLLSLLHTGSDRVQRQVISLLRRMILEISPQKMLGAINSGSEPCNRLTLLDHLVCYLAKAITLQVKVKGSGTAVEYVTMGSSVTPQPATWFMRGETTKNHANLVAKLLADMSEDKISHPWGSEVRGALAQYVCAVSTMPENERTPELTVASHVPWLALAALCVASPEHLDMMNGRTSDPRDSVSGREAVFCANHEDGATAAAVECRDCGPLCAECDRFLHLRRAARCHQRQICKEEERAIRVDIHEGCGRAKLFWLMLLVDRRTLKGLIEFRGVEPAPGSSGSAGAAGLSGICRFCGTRGQQGLLAIGNVCADQQCQEHGREACIRVLPCGHLCGGVRSERTCLPCLLGCPGESPPLRQDADDMCMVCFTDPLQAAPAIQLKCGHVFHLQCCKKVLANKWVGPRITFSFAQCPICKDDMEHWTLEEFLVPIGQLREEVRRKALMRLKYEGAAAAASGSVASADPAQYAMERYAYYVCHKCGKAYFGGLARCEAESNGAWEPSELVCGACSDVASARICPKHGADFLEYKCRYCCSVAVFFCFGTSHFCNSCHDDFQRVTNIPKDMLPQCPAGPKGEQLPGSSEECPLHVQHPPTGEEFALGCGVCRHAHSF